MSDLLRVLVGLVAAVAIAVLALQVAGWSAATHRADEGGRLVATTTSPLLGATSAAAVTTAARISHRIRRIGDVGDSWRSLLLGAPPVLA